MQIELSGTWDKLRERGYRGPFFMIHNTGGCADLFKTTASRTYNGGPIAGLIGARDIARQLGAHNVVTADVGGTSFDIGLVVGDSVRNYEFNPIIDQWMVSTTMLQSLSIGAGGGSIAWINRALGDRLEVGPQSAGSFPGPVAYQLGGTEPTVTDANLVLGYLSPDEFFAGRMALDRDAAEDAIRERIAEPLGLAVVEAAALIRRIIDDKMASAIRKEVTLRGYRPSEFTLFAFGGGGPTHVAGYMGEIPRAVMFPFSPVFCAYGSSIMDVVHLYERSHRMMLLAPLTGAPTVDREAFNAMVERADGRGAARGRGRGPQLGRRDRQPRARHALRRPDPLQAGVLAAAVHGVRGRRARGLRALRAGVQRGVQPARGQRARAACTSTRSCCASRSRARSSSCPSWS